VIASSYITLGLFAGEKAAHLWWPYSIVMFVLVLVTTGAEVVRRAGGEHRHA
jgi:hypothetical protein